MRGAWFLRGFYGRKDGCGRRAVSEDDVEGLVGVIKAVMG